MQKYFETHNFQLEDRKLCTCVSKVSVDDTHLTLFTEKITILANFY